MARICKVLLLVAPLVLGLAACGSGSTSGTDTPERRVLTVAAASSLTDVFTEVGEAFEAANPGVEVRFTFDSSGTLATQVREGAPIDVLATADAESMAPVADAGLLADDPTEFAGNLLVIVTRAGEGDPFLPGGDGFADIGVLALCASTAPCGRLADERLAGLTDEGIVSEDRITRAPNARATLTAVTEGDADAALVFATDALAAGDAVESYELGMDEQSPTTTYLAAPMAAASEPDLAASFVRALRSSATKDLLAQAGFWVPGRGVS